jgi:hypothetical protein
MKRDLNDINGRIAAARRAEWQRSSLIVVKRGERDEPKPERYQGTDRSGEKGNAGKDLCLSLQSILHLG